MEYHLNQKKVLCVGLCCLDVVMFCKSYPLEDSDQRCLSQKWQVGGNASNSCTVLSEFNIPCEILGSMSHDLGGQFLKENFAQHKISFQNCHFYKEHASATSVIWINVQNGSRTIVASDAKMPEVSFEDFKKLNLNNYCWIHIECRYNIEDIKLMIQHIRQWNAQSRSNIIPISIEIEKPRLEQMELLKLGDFVFVSKDFASACGLTNMESAVLSLSKELNSGCAIICAWGDKGACAKPAEGDIHIVKGYSPPKLVSTLAAGDTFVAATIISLLKSQDLEHAIDTGCRVAGAKCGMESFEGLAKLFPSIAMKFE